MFWADRWKISNSSWGGFEHEKSQFTNSISTFQCFFRRNEMARNFSDNNRNWKNPCATTTKFGGNKSFCCVHFTKRISVHFIISLDFLSLNAWKSSFEWSEPAFTLDEGEWWSFNNCKTQNTLTIPPKRTHLSWERFIIHNEKCSNEKRATTAHITQSASTWHDATGNLFCWKLLKSTTRACCRQQCWKELLKRFKKGSPFVCSYQIPHIICINSRFHTTLSRPCGESEHICSKKCVLCCAHHTSKNSQLN